MNQDRGKRRAEEFQLLAEKKWILEALAKIKNQRNCLQIERLHLESIKSKIKSTKHSIPPSPRDQVLEDDFEAETSTVNLMQNTTAMQNTTEQKEAVDIDFDNVNNEELNLDVNIDAFNMNLNPDLDIEEEDEIENDDMFIDMNMLMNGAPSSHI